SPPAAPSPAAAPPPPAAVAAAASPVKAAAPPPAGAFRAHLASFPARAAAEDEWKRVQKLAGDLVAGLAPTYEEVDVPGKGRFVRLYTGGFADKGQAKAFCDRLLPRKIKCLPAAR
ncbi:MAG: SPOR domain-containing protein, partial [Rhodospirillales bacterium]|nr:SPOR domain-containing protein [Rhodospirillales bacterium]